MEVHNGTRYLRMSDMVLALGVTRKTIMRWVRIGDFPAPVRIGGRLLLWKFSDYEAWCQGAKPVV